MVVLDLFPCLGGACPQIFASLIYLCYETSYYVIFWCKSSFLGKVTRTKGMVQKIDFKLVPLLLS